jgi:hypothetical protein
MIKNNLSLLAAKKEGLGNSILRAAQKATTALTSDGGHMIRVSFKNTGLVPFKPAIFMKNAKLNIGEIDTTTTQTIIDQYTSAAVIRLKNALDEAHSDIVNIASKDIKEPRLFSDVEIVELKKKQNEKLQTVAKIQALNKERRLTNKEVRIATKESRNQIRKNCICQGDHKNESKPPIFRGGKGWKRCNKCNEFFLCPKHAKNSTQMLEDHVKKNHDEIFDDEEILEEMDELPHKMFHEEESVNEDGVDD